VEEVVGLVITVTPGNHDNPVRAAEVIAESLGTAEL
jgi:hypothetical protein